MPETMESARRWSGYVCPDCRFVFRVPRDHDGQGLVCPSCRRLLKIPVAGDRPPPLMVPLKTPAAGEIHSVVIHHGDRRRKKKSRHSDGHAWDSSSGRSRRSGREEKRQMFWMLVGGGSLFALILAGVLMAMLGGDQAAAPATGPTTTKAPPPSHTPESAAVPVTGKSDAAFLAEAEPMARKFLEATRIGEMLPLVRNPEVAGERMQRFYPDGAIPAPGMSAFNTESDITRAGSIVTLKVRTREFEEKPLSFVETPAGIRIDWESWVGWSEIPWEDFLATKPTEPKVFRLNLSSIEYYNTAFTDDKKWQSYRLLSPDGKHAIYGYAERGSVLNARLRPPPDSKQVAMMLSLKFPANAASNNQVIVEKHIIDGWVLENEEPP